MEILKVGRCFVRSGGFSGCWLGRLDKLERLDKLYRLVSGAKMSRLGSGLIGWFGIACGEEIGK